VNEPSHWTRRITTRRWSLALYLVILYLALRFGGGVEQFTN
jgi:hypothetical protein